MNFKVIRADNLIIKDGTPVEFDFDLTDEIWAIYWDGSNGFIEYTADVPNEDITDFSDYQYLIDAYDAELARQTAAAEQAIADRIAAMTYADKRKDEYPDVGDQLDDLFRAGAFSDEMTAEIQAVKDKYPK